jgi:hypothetical protein
LSRGTSGSTHASNPLDLTERFKLCIQLHPGLIWASKARLKIDRLKAPDPRFPTQLRCGHVGRTSEFSRHGGIKNSTSRSLSGICFEVGVNVFDITSRRSEGRSEEIPAMALKGERAKPSFYGFTVSPDERSLIDLAI